jgi:hypothetical protein
MTRVSVFLQQNSYEFESWEEASPDIRIIAKDVTVHVRQGRSVNFADLEIRCDLLGLILKCSICDLMREASPMLESMERSFVTDTSDERFDYWDQLPPFGVVHMYGITMVHQQSIDEPLLAAFFILLDHFLLNHFLMYAFCDSEMTSLHMIEHAGDMKTFIHDDRTCYRVKNFG